MSLLDRLGRLEARYHITAAMPVQDLARQTADPAVLRAHLDALAAAGTLRADDLVWAANHGLLEDEMAAARAAVAAWHAEQERTAGPEWAQPPAPGATRATPENAKGT